MGDSIAQHCLVYKWTSFVSTSEKCWTILSWGIQRPQMCCLKFSVLPWSAWKLYHDWQVSVFCQLDDLNTQDSHDFQNFFSGPPNNVYKGTSNRQSHAIRLWIICLWLTTYLSMGTWEYLIPNLRLCLGIVSHQLHNYLMLDLVKAHWSPHCWDIWWNYVQ